MWCFFTRVFEAGGWTIQHIQNFSKTWNFRGSKLTTSKRFSRIEWCDSWYFGHWYSGLNLEIRGHWSTFSQISWGIVGWGVQCLWEIRKSDSNRNWDGNEVCKENEWLQRIASLRKLAPGNQWLKDEFPFGTAYFQRQAVSFISWRIYFHQS